LSYRLLVAVKALGQEKEASSSRLVRVYNPAKTVADCFKYRNMIGLDVALEALRDYRRQRRCTNSFTTCKKHS
jgi:hypothetical protein